MSLHMIDGNEWNGKLPAKFSRKIYSRPQRRLEARTLGDGDRIDLFLGDAGVCLYFFKKNRQIFEMLAFCKSGEDSAVLSMELDLRMDNVAENAVFENILVGTGFKQAQSRFVTARFDTENYHVRDTGLEPVTLPTSRGCSTN